MADPLTSTIRLTQPAVDGDSGVWPGLLNGNALYVDQATNQSITVAIPDTNVTLTADGSAADQARYWMYEFTGSLTATRTVTLPSNQKLGLAVNATSGGHQVVLSAGGTTFSLPPDGAFYSFECDGTNVASTMGTIGTSGNNGVLHLPNGITMQWGNVSNTNGTPNPFTYTFSALPWAVVLSASGASPTPIVACTGLPLATSSFTAFTGTVAGSPISVAVNYLAIGPT